MAGPLGTRCPVCTGDVDAAGEQHCPSDTCTWATCACGTIVARNGLWIAAGQAGGDEPATGMPA